MHSICFTALLLSMLAGTGLAAYAGIRALKDDFSPLPLLEKGQVALTAHFGFQ